MLVFQGGGDGRGYRNTHIFVILFCNSKPYNFDCESKDCKLKCNEVDECSCPPPLSLKNIFQSKYSTVDPDSLQRPGKVDLI